MKKLIIAYLFTITNVFAAPPTYFNGELQTNTYIQNIKAPNYQTTPLGGIDRRLETGNLNELQNPNFEHTTVGTSWTISNATASGNTANPLEGKKSISLALTGALSLSQSSTINAAQKSGVQMVASIWVNSSDVSDLQLCSLKNGSEDKCTVSGGYVQGSGWRQLTVSFLGDATSNGLKLKSTDTTGTVLVDSAFVGVGSPIVDFTPDMVFSAKGTTTTGTITEENTDWISGNGTAANGTVITFVAGKFTVAPNCQAAPVGTSTAIMSISGLTASGVTVTSYNSLTLALIASQPFVLTCQKQGADYKTSKAYVASGSVALNTTVYSAQISSTGSVSNESTDWISSNCTNANPTVCTLRTTENFITVPMNCVATPITPNDIIATIDVNTSDITIWTKDTTGAASSRAVKLVCQKQGADYTAAFNPVIVGSFQGYNETPGVSAPKLFSFRVTTTSGAVANSRGGYVTSCTAANPTVCTLTGLTSAPTCSTTITGASSGGNNAVQNALATSTSLNIYTYTTSTGLASASQPVEVICHGN